MLGLNGIYLYLALVYSPFIPIDADIITGVHLYTFHLTGPLLFIADQIFTSHHTGLSQIVGHNCCMGGHSPWP